MNPAKAFNILNNLQREVCPEAYEPEVVLAQRVKQDQLEAQLRMKEQELKEMQEMDKRLFDFDDELDQLSEVSERYKVIENTQVQVIPEDKDKTLESKVLKARNRRVS